MLYTTTELKISPQKDESFTKYYEFIRAFP